MNFRYIKLSLARFLQDRFDLGEDKATEAEVIASIEKGVVVKGVNLWILIFAIIIASVGLNVNSTAVIIGAMLISPLMGPIMGIGVALGIYDSELMYRSLRNLLIAVVLSLIASAIYFAITPLSLAQSELLARTNPTVWDVIIAFFGGLAGFIAQSRRDRTSTVIPGVAIATALMPPLCTAGYGLGTGQPTYFLGALYLFLINAVFITLATFALVRFMKFQKKHLMDKVREKRLRGYMAAVITIMLVPSVIFAYKIVNQTIFETNVDAYINSSFDFRDTQVIDYHSHYDSDSLALEVVLVGKPLASDVVAQLNDRLRYHKLSGVTLMIRNVDGDSVRDGSRNFEHFYEVSTSLINDRDKEIEDLKNKLQIYSRDILPSDEIAREFAALASSPHRFAISKVPAYGVDSQVADSMIICYIDFDSTSKSMASETKETIRKWLQTRTKCSNVKIIIE